MARFLILNFLKKPANCSVSLSNEFFKSHRWYQSFGISVEIFVEIIDQLTPLLVFLLGNSGIDLFDAGGENEKKAKK